MSEKAMIVGISGQTGSLLAQRLLAEGYAVVGSSRDVAATDWWRLKQLGIRDEVRLISVAPDDFSSVFNALHQHSPDYIFYLGGQSSVGLSFAQPFEAFRSVAIGPLNYLETLRLSGLPSRFFNSASTDCFGNQPGIRVSEASPMKPTSPYGVAKTASYWTTVNYRDSFGLYATNGILTNHESGLRGRAFVTHKIVTSLLKKLEEPTHPLVLGNTKISRDWLWAPDVVDAILRIIKAPQPGDFIVASGESHTLEDFVRVACERLGLSPQGIFESVPSLFRPNEIESINLDSSLIQETLGWRPSVDFSGLIQNLIDDLRT